MSWINQRWHVSSFSSDGNCVEVRQNGDTVAMRHSRHRDGPMLQFTRGEWDAFLAGVRNLEFDLSDSTADRA